MLIDFRTLHLRLCLGAIAFMVSVPFLMAHHYNPIPSFFQEWTAAAFGLVALTALLQHSMDEPLEVPEIALLPLGLMAIAVLQWLFLPDVLVDRLLLFGLYLAWALALMILGRYFARTIGLQTLADVVATAILAGALLEAVSGYLQLAGMARQPWVFPTVSLGLRGNLAQPNSFSDYLWLGVVSLIYLSSRNRYSSTALLLSLLVLLPASVLSGSRSIWLYSLAIAILSLTWSWGLRDKATTTIRLWSIGALVGSALLQALFASDWLTAASSTGITTAGGRVADQGFGDSTRLVLWHFAARIFLENPWLGAGFGQYTRQFFLHALDLPPNYYGGVPEHAHNIGLNLLAEMGLAAGLLLIGLLGRWIWALARIHRAPECWWVAGLAAILGIHSNLEYPLWYSFFLGLAAFLAGAVAQDNLNLRLERTSPFAIVLALVLGLVSLQRLHHDYSKLEDSLNNRTAANSAREQRQRTMDVLQQLSRNSLFSPYADLAIAHRMAEHAEDLEAKLQICDRALRFSPSRDVVFKCAYFVALAGREDEGERAFRLAVASYPDIAARYLERWRHHSATESLMARLDERPALPAIAAR